MRTLNRPMFRMGGPIKQGIMHGIREPKNMGGRMLLVGQHPKQFRDAGGREQHFAPVVAAGGLLSAAGRFLPAAYRGFKAARAYKPWSQNLGVWGRFKDIFKPSAGLGAPMAEKGAGAGFRTGSFLRSNPLTSLSLVPQTATLAGKGAVGGFKSIPDLAKSYVEAVLPGDQSSWWAKEQEKNLTPPPVKQGKAKGVPGGGDAGMTYTDPEKAKKLAAKRRDDRVNDLLEIMGYDKAKKTAAYDALIDASQIVMDRGTLSKKNIGRDLINPIIAATSKRFDKPEQIREAVGLLAAKGEIEKDVAAGKGSTTMQTAKDMVATGASPNIQSAMKTLTKQSTMADTLGAIVAKGGKVGADEVEIALRIENPDIIPKLKIKGSDDSYKKWKDKNKGKTEMDFMEEIVTKSDSFAGPGVYIINKRAIVVDDQDNMAYEW